MEYTTAILEAIGVEHKETTRYVYDHGNHSKMDIFSYILAFIPSRNYDILAAVFTDVLKNMHDDFDFV